MARSLTQSPPLLFQCVKCFEIAHSVGERITHLEGENKMLQSAVGSQRAGGGPGGDLIKATGGGKEGGGL